MSKKLLQINTVLNSGSTGRIAEAIGLLAIDNGWESYIAFGRWNRKSASEKIKIGNRWDTLWHVLMTRLFDKHGLFSKRATKKLIQQIQLIQPDIIQIHNLHGYYINYKILFTWLSKRSIPVIWTLHDCWTITGHCSYFEIIGCDRWKTECNNCPQKRKYPQSLFIDDSTNNYKHKKTLFTSVSNMTIVPVSYWLGDIIKQSFLNTYPVQVIQNGIDISLFSPKTDIILIREKYDVENKFVLLGVANIWDPRKGLKDFVALNKIIDHNIYIIILVGLNKKQIKHLPEEISGIERTESVQELAELYSVADVFLNPTWEDTFSTTNLEALSCGTPVITYRTGGTVESVSEDTGFIVEKGDVEGLYTVVKEIHEKGKLHYSQKCRERAVVYYDKRERFNDYIKLFDQLLNNRL
jgi:glycosyltransferase involved in cell wall biosynthesis